MESFKNGHVISDKYVCAQKSQENVKVAVFLNHVQQCHQCLSADRVRIYNLDYERPNVKVTRRVTAPSKKQVRFEKKPYSQPASPAESERSDSTTQSLRELCDEMKISPSAKSGKSELCEEQEAHLLCLYGQTVAKDLGELNRQFRVVGISQAMKLFTDYLLKCTETGEAIEICKPDAIDKVTVWKKEEDDEPSAIPKPDTDTQHVKDEEPTEDESDDDVEFQGVFKPQLPKEPRTVECKPLEPFVIVKTKDKIPMKDIARSEERPRPPDRPPHLRGMLHTPEGQSVSPPLQPVQKCRLSRSRIAQGMEDIRVSLQSRMDNDAHCDDINAQIAEREQEDIEEAVLIEAAKEAEDHSNQAEIEDDILAAIEE